MKWSASISKSLLALAVTIAVGTAVAVARPVAGVHPAAGTDGDSVIISKTEFERLKYTRHVNRYRRGWAKLIPNITTVQYAGDIGMFSLGIGWDYGKHDRWETHILIGYLPKYHADNHDFTFTLKENLIPWNIKVNEWCNIDPVCFTLFFNSIFDDEFWTEEPDRYPKGYYGFSSRIRTSIGLGGRFNFTFPNTKGHYNDRLSLYYELNSCDLLIVSAVTNRNITLGDILRLGLGVQYRFF